MVDIAKCGRSDCKKKLSCFRYLADDDEYGQSYIAIEGPEPPENCELYWRVRNSKELAQMNRWNR